MQKRIRITLITLALITGLSILAGLMKEPIRDAWAAIQSQVGINTLETTTNTWRPILNFLTNTSDNDIPPTAPPGTTLDVDAMLRAFNGTGFDRLRNSVPADAIVNPTIGALNASTFGLGFNGTTWDRLRTGAGADGATTGISNIGNYIFNGTTWDRWRDANGVNGQAGVGIPASGLMVFNGTTSLWARVGNLAGIAADGFAGASVLTSAQVLFNGTTGDRARAISAATLAATTSVGTQTVTPLSTWSVTHTPAAATQATASKAAGGGTVRHVATTITACSAQSATAQTPIAINLRDGATGAGTILRTWKVSSIIQDSKCVDLSGLAMIGTANTAMTLEFAAAGVAASEQTVTLTGYSVP